MSENPYSLEEINFEDPLFDFIDMTYIVTLVGSPRIEEVRRQLEERHISGAITIVHNKGYKQCHKQVLINDRLERINHPAHDLVHAYNFIMNHALEHNYQNILLLEDDFIFSDQINDPEVVEDIRNKVRTMSSSELYLKLGCIPLVTHPDDSKFNRIMYSGGTHAIIYNHNMIKKIIDDHIFRYCTDQDSNNKIKNKLMYHRPLVYQTFPMTPNRKLWGTSDPNRSWPLRFLFVLMTLLSDFIIHYLKMDTQPEPGTSFFYNKIQPIARFFLSPYIYLTSGLFLTRTHTA